MFQGRKLIIATMHHKEKVIAPILEKNLGVICFTNESLNTDLLGTFTGEINRIHDPITTVRNKCLQAMKLFNCDLGIASEGSFGPHPSIFFANADDEFLIFIDSKNNIEIIVRELSTDTNFDEQEIKSYNQLLDFANKAKFPSHGIILRKSKKEYDEIYKGINTFELLKSSFDELYENHTTIFAETDMRALYNPSRMHVIELATEKLIQKLKSICPKCSTPGFDVTESKKGLKCELCGRPTNSVLSTIYCCKHCEYSKEEMYPYGKTFEDPTFCDFCNP